MDTECSLYPWLFFGIGQEEKWYLPRLLRHFNVLAGERMRVLPGGTNPQEGWPMSGETQQSLRRENIDVRGKKGNLLERKEQARACKLNRGTGSTEQALVWRAKSTKTCMNVQGWSKKSLKSSFWDVFLFEVGLASCLQCGAFVNSAMQKEPCPTRAFVLANQVVPV